MLSIFCVISAIAVESAPTELEKANLKVNCFIRRLKSKEKLDASYPEHEVISAVINCDDVIKELEVQLYKKLALNFRRKHQLNDLTPCLMRDARAENWVDDFMLIEVYAASETLSESQKNLKFIENTDKISSVIKNAVDNCEVVLEFSEYYDELVDDRKSSMKTEQQLQLLYCARKYVVEHNLVDPTVHEIELNPTNLALDGIDCEALLEEKFKSLEETFVKMLNDDNLDSDSMPVKCIKKKFRDGKHGEKFMTIVVVSDTDLSDEQKLDEKIKFANFYVDVYNSLDLCDH